LNRADREDRHGLSEKTFDAGAVVINYAEGEDNGPALVLLHGLGRRWQVFLPLIASLESRWHIYAPDLRGHGKSGRVTRGYRGVQYSEDIAAFLQQCVAGPAVLFGHSLGGLVGMWIAANRPELVSALIIGDSMMSHSSFQQSLYPTLFFALSGLARSGGSLEDIARGLARIELQVPNLPEPVLIGDLPGNDEAYLLWWARCVKQADPDTYNMSVDGSSFAGWDGDALLRKIKCPTLLLQANQELGGLMTDADVQRALTLLAHPVHVQFPTLGHALYMQQAEPVLRAVNDFLEVL
jgi:pimeloyl-ACP methyl ester carboxylesterase